jgi:hypothetical protein
MAACAVARREAGRVVVGYGRSAGVSSSRQVQSRMLNGRVYRSANKDETGGGQEEEAMRSTGN